MNKTKIAGLLGIPLAILGIVGSAAFAQTQGSASSSTAMQGEVQDQYDNRADGEQNDAQESAALQAQAKISEAQAKQIAQEKVGSGTAADVRLDDEDGVLKYEVHIGDQEVDVNATDGAVITHEGADDEHSEHR